MTRTPSAQRAEYARHSHLVQQRSELTRRLEGDPDYFDAKLAGTSFGTGHDQHRIPGGF
jgi:hypothetical protein